jgi:Icc protein
MTTLLRLVHISDTHINPDTTYTQHGAPTPIVGAQALVDAMNALPFQPDFVLHTGDVVYDPYPEAYIAAKNVLGQLKAPVYYLAGNHDDSASLQRSLLGRSEATVTQYLTYETEINGVQLVVMDSNGPAEVPTGNVPDEQLAWLESLVMAEDTRPLLVAIHHNLMPLGAPWLDDWMRTNNGEAVHYLLKQAGPRLQAVLHGHIHQNTLASYDGVLYISAASSWLQFMSYPSPDNTEVLVDHAAQPGFNVVHLTTEGISVRVHQITVNG